MIKKLIFFLPVLLVLAAALFILKFNPWYVKSESISLEGVGCVNEVQIKSAADILNQNLLLLNTSSIEQKLLGKYYCLGSVSVKKVFPSKVEIKAVGRQGVLVLIPKELEASVSAGVSSFLTNITPDEATPSSQSALLEDLIKKPDTSNNGNDYIVDKGGVVYSTVNAPQKLPQAYWYNGPLDLGVRIDPDLVNGTLTIVNKLREFSIPVDLVMIKESDLGVKGGNLSLFFALDNGIDRQLASLQLILQDRKMSESSIDLRFNKPVVVYSQK